MQVKEIMNNMGKFVREHDNSICAVAAVVGVVTTVGLTIRATLKTKEALDQYEAEKETLPESVQEEVEEKSEVKAKAKIIFINGWYVVVSAAGTIIFMLASHKLSLKKIKAGLATAGYWREAYVTYKDKVREKLGDTAEKDISAEIAKDKYEENFDPNVIYQIGKGQVLFIDPFGRLVRSSIQEIMQMQYDFNHHYFDEWLEDWKSINDVCEWFNLPNICSDLGDYTGFTREWPLDIQVNQSQNGPMLPTGEIATVLEFASEPVLENGTSLRNFRY